MFWKCYLIISHCFILTAMWKFSLFYVKRALVLRHCQRGLRTARSSRNFLWHHQALRGKNHTMELRFCWTLSWTQPQNWQRLSRGHGERTCALNLTSSMSVNVPETSWLLQSTKEKSIWLLHRNLAKKFNSESNKMYLIHRVFKINCYFWKYNGLPI